MGDVRKLGDAARRAAESLLRSTGGRTVYLRIPADGAPGSIGEQLGLELPRFQDAELSPTVFRRARPHGASGAPRWELMVSAISVSGVLGITGLQDARELFARAAGLVAGESVMEIESMSSSDLDGVPYVYRLVLRVAAANAI